MQFWLSKLAFLSPALVQDAVNAGRMTVNGDCTTSDHRLAANEVIEYAFHLHEPPVCTSFKNEILTFFHLVLIKVLDLPIDVIHVDDDILVVNKPPSIPVHPVGAYKVSTHAMT